MVSLDVIRNGFIQNDASAQTRRLSAGIDSPGDAIIGAGFVPVIPAAGRALHTALPDDERAAIIKHYSRSSRKCRMLSNLFWQTNPGFDASDSKRQWISSGSDTLRFGSYPDSSDKSRNF